MVREGDITQSREKSLVLRKLQLRQSCRWNVTVFAENVSDSITQVRCKVQLTRRSQEIDPDHVSVMCVKATNLKSYGFLVLCNSFNSNSRSVTVCWRQHVDFGFAMRPHQTFVAREKIRKPGQRSGVWHQCGVLDSHCVANLVLTVREDDITQSRANPWSSRILQLRHSVQSCRIKKNMQVSSLTSCSGRYRSHFSNPSACGSGKWFVAAVSLAI